MAVKSIPRSRCIFLSKHTTGMCGVGKFIVRWKERNNPDCPRCGAFEDPHVWKCKGWCTPAIWNKDWTNSPHGCNQCLPTLMFKQQLYTTSKTGGMTLTSIIYPLVILGISYNSRNPWDGTCSLRGGWQLDGKT
jgi:hypothetical protein